MTFPIPPSPPSQSMSPEAFNAAVDAWLAWETEFAVAVAAIGTPGLGGGDMTGDLGLAAEVDVASAATCNIGAAASNKVRITGTTTITSLGSSTNRLKFVRFAGALTLTNNATTLILPGGTDIITQADDVATFTSDASGNWRLRSYQAAAVPIMRRVATITDDAVSSIPLPQMVGAVVTLIPNDAAYPRGLFWIRTSGGGAIANISTGGATFGFYTTALTGTTGTDGQFNIGVTSAALYLENRTGGTKSTSLKIDPF